MASGNFPGGSGCGPLLSASLEPGKLWLRLGILDNLPSPQSFIWFLLLGRSLFALGVRISLPPARDVASHAHSLRKLKGSCCLGEWSPRLAGAFGRGCLPPALGQVYCAIGPLQRPRIWLTPDMGETQAGIRCPKVHPGATLIQRASAQLCIDGMANEATWRTGAHEGIVWFLYRMRKIRI